ncbi:MAG: dihydroneopterin aldolase [Ferruginibacter sp.]
MITIALNNLVFYSHHGVHPEETVLGTHFELDVAVTFEEKGVIKNLEDTVDYVSIYQIIQQHMQRPSRLLETVAMQLAEEIYKNNSGITTINICISKLNPPINNFTGKVGITYRKDYL